MASDNTLHLTPGDTLQLEFADTSRPGRFYVTLIGHVHKRSLIVTTPQTEGKTLFIKEGQVFSARMLSGNMAQGFVTSVLASRTQPFPYLHLKPPTEVEVAKVRQSHRVRVTLTMVAQRNTDANEPPAKANVPGRILDLSTSGALIATVKSVGEVGDILKLSTRLAFERMARQVTVQARIRNRPEHHELAQDEKTPHCYGVSFDDLSDFDRLLLKCFVNEQIINQLLG